MLTGLAVANAARAQPAAEPAAMAAGDLGVSASHDAIHQEVTFQASPARLYHVLTDARSFDRVVNASGAIPAMSLRNTRAVIHAVPGGAFSLFGDHITGRQIELEPNVRVVQAWRAGNWAPHVFSIVKFELEAHPAGVLLTFDHTGFPDGEAVSLATGWRKHYWAPIAKVLK